MENTKKDMRAEDLNDKRNVNNNYGIVDYGIVDISGPPKLKNWITKHELNLFH
jgi:hypothetical protein